MNNDNPIKSSINYLVECGWSEDEAKNLIRAIHDKNPDRLWEIAPQWIQHCGEKKMYVTGVLESVAMGLIAVTKSDNGEWMFELNATGLGVGKQLKGDA